MNKVIIKEATNAHLDYFYADWSFAVGGVIPDKANVDALMDWLKNEGVLKNQEEYEVFKVSGKQMNEKYSLTGTNAYNETYTILVLPLNNFSNVGKLAISRFNIGGRWFTDIVDNNARREEERA